MLAPLIWGGIGMRLVGFLGFACVLAGAGLANPVEDACLSAGRAEDPALCSCVGTAAGLTLSDQDQRRAAGFFADPHAAQETRMSDRRRDETFWDRYLVFGQTAEELCN